MSNLDSISGSNALKFSNDPSNPDSSSNIMSGRGYDNNTSSGYGNSASSDYGNNTTSSGYDSTGTSAFGNPDQFTNPHHDHSKGIAPVHHQTTSNSYENSNTTNFDSTSNNDNISNPTSAHPAAGLTGPINPSTESAPLNPHTRPSIVAADNNSTDDTPAMAGDTTIRRSSVAQNAPGTAGEVGENVMGALGYGGSRVERPREDQGLGEKIVNFLGA